MAITEAEKEINGVRYKTRAVPQSKGLPVLKLLIDTLSPLGAAFLRGAIPADRVANALDVLPQVTPLAEIQRLAVLFGEHGAYFEEGAWTPLDKGVQELHFAANYVTFLQWLMWNIEVNFGNFFDGAKGAQSDVARILQMMGLQVPPTKPSPGTSDSSGGS